MQTKRKKEKKIKADDEATLETGFAYCTIFLVLYICLIQTGIQVRYYWANRVVVYI